MIFEGPDGAFGGVDSVFFRRDPLEADLVAEEGIFEVLGAFVVKDAPGQVRGRGRFPVVEGRWMEAE
jgi:hypothetical protein